MRPLFPNVSPAVATAMAAEGAPRCQADRVSKYLNDTKLKNQCEHSARYEHEGTHYCTRHAAALALAILIERSAAQSR